MSDKLFTGQSGAGLVKITIDANGQAHHVEIDDLVFTKEDKQLISDLFVAALNDAYRRVDEEFERRYDKKGKGLKNLIPIQSLYNLTNLLKPPSDDDSKD